MGGFLYRTFLRVPAYHYHYHHHYHVVLAINLQISASWTVKGCVRFDARLQASSFPGKPQVHIHIDAGGACLMPERRVLTEVKYLELPCILSFSRVDMSSRLTSCVQ